MPEWDVKSLKKETANNFADWYSTVPCFESDILVVHAGASDNGMVFKGKNGVAGTALLCLTPLGLDTNYLFYYLKYREFEHKTERNLKNTFWEMEIPIPPIEEQKSIARSIQATYQNFEAQNKEAEKDLLDSIKSLLPQIQSQKFDLIEEDNTFLDIILSSVFCGTFTTNENEKVAFNQENLKAIKDTYLINPALDEIIEDTTEVSFVPMSAINPLTNEINLSISKIYRAAKKGYTKFKENDLLFAKVTPSMENGKFAIAKGLTNGIGCGTTELHIIRSNDKNSVEYLRFFLLQNSVRKFATEFFEGSTGLRRVSTNFFSEKILPLPSLEEQKRLVQVIENMFPLIGQLQQTITDLRNKKNFEKNIICNFFETYESIFSQTDWDLDAQIKVAREKKEKELAELKKKQKTFQKTLFNFGNMKKDDKDRIKKKIKEVTRKNFASFEVLTEREIELLRESVKGSSNKSYTDEDFAAVFLEMTQDNFEGEEPPFFESEIINGDTLAFKFQK